MAEQDYGRNKTKLPRAGHSIYPPLCSIELVGKIPSEKYESKNVKFRYANVTLLRYNNMIYSMLIKD